MSEELARMANKEIQRMTSNYIRTVILVAELALMEVWYGKRCIMKGECSEVYAKPSFYDWAD